MDGRIYVVEFTDIVGFLGFFLVILIALELMKSVWVQVPDRTIHIEVMFEITIIFAIIALTRKILLPEPKSEPLYLVGTAALVVDLAVGCYTEFRTARSPDPAS